MWPLLFGIQAADRAWLEPGRQAEASAQKEKREAEILARDAALRADYEQTVGANLLRGESNSMAVTLRDSVSLAGSRIEWLTGVWDRIHRETGCDIGSTVYLEALPKFPWGQREPEAYVVTLTNCPPNQVRSGQ